MLAALSFVSCQGGVLVRVRVTGRPATASTVVVTAALNEVPALGTGQSLTRTPDSFNVQLQETLRGPITLHLRAQNERGCDVAVGEGTVEIAGPGTYVLDVTLQPQAGCSIEVELVGPAAGSVQSVPAGITCGAQCRQVFELNQVVNLTATTSARFGAWFADADSPSCAGRVGCSLSIGSGLTRVRAHFIRPESCAASDWCTEEPLPPLPSRSNLYAVWGSGRDDVWVVGDSGSLLHGDGILWTAVTPVTDRGLRAVWGSGRADAWAVGERGAGLRWNGRSWSALPMPTQAWLNGVWGSGRGDVWAVGDSGTILHFDGRAWTSVPSGTTRSLRGVWGSGPRDIFAAGDSGTVLRWDGSSWTALNNGASSAHLSAVWGSGASRIWFVGDSGVILSWNGSTLSREESGTSSALRAIWGTSASQVWAVGDGGTMLTWNGARWSAVDLEQPQFGLAGIWGSSVQDVWAVGQSASLLRYRP